MNKLEAESFIIYRKNGTEELIVRDVEIEVVEKKVEKKEITDGMLQ